MTENLEEIQNHQKIIDRQFIENNKHLPYLIFPHEKYTKFQSRKSKENIITPFILVDDELFDRTPNIMSTQFGSVKTVTKKKSLTRSQSQNTGNINKTQIGKVTFQSKTVAENPYE